MFEAKFQSFTDTERGVDTGAKLKTLRARLSALGLDGFIVPRADEHQNEYVAPRSVSVKLWNLASNMSSS